jgi:hypothetical protein
VSQEAYRHIRLASVDDNLVRRDIGRVVVDAIPPALPIGSYALGVSSSLRDQGEHDSGSSLQVIEQLQVVAPLLQVEALGELLLYFRREDEVLHCSYQRGVARVVGMVGEGGERTQ